MPMRDDMRPIAMLNGDQHTFAMVGSNGVTSIVPYQETGQMAHVTWFKVYVEGGSFPRRRVNGAYVAEVVYADQEDEDVPF